MELELAAALGNRLRRCTDPVAMRFRNGATLSIVFMLLSCGGLRIVHLHLEFVSISVSCIVFLGSSLVCMALAFSAQKRADKRISWARAGKCMNCGFDLYSCKRKCPACSTEISPIITYYSLPRFFEIYFCERWYEDAPDDDGILAQAIERERDYEIIRVAKQLQAFLDQGYADTEVAKILHTDFKCRYDPAEFGITTIDWIVQVIKKLHAAYPGE